MSSIEWTDRTWNPVRGCSRVSEGCRNCYAERIATRFSGPGGTYEGFADVAQGRRHSQNGRATTGVRGHWTGRVELIPSKLDEPLHWRKPARVFVNSMSDLFHEALTNGEINRVFAVMARAPQHTFQILTKRPARMLDYFAWARVANATVKEWPLPNVWLGVSVEDQATADERILRLRQTPAAKRFVSYEPALGPVDFSRSLWPVHDHWPAGYGSPEAARAAGAVVTRHRQALVSAHAVFVDWIIVGGESGPGARPFDVAWARETVRQCREAGVAVFVKQLGSKPTTDHRTRPAGEESYWTRLLKDPKGGDPSAWPEDLRVREFPASAP